MKSTISIAFIALGSVITLLNWTVPFRYFVLRDRKKSLSLVPLIGGALLSLGLFLSTNATSSQLFWVPLFIDIGCLPMVGMFLWKIFRDQWGQSH